MSSSIELQATTRNDLGKGASRRLRHTGKVPAVVYGIAEPVSITLPHKDLWKAQESEEFYASVFTLSIDGKANHVILKDLQRHPAKSVILHADFLRVDDNTLIVVNVPLHFVNADTCPGVKNQGGTVQLLTSLIKLRCAATKLPKYIEVDLGNANLGDVIHISNVQLPEGVQSVELQLGASHDLPIAQVINTKSDETAAKAEG